jgi:2-oxoisovalerate dehydrogenase E2 component (dihydrolipoyl transacylase)
MAEHAFRLPDVGEGIAEAEIVAWHVKRGDWVEEDQPLVDVMTDKATVEITSPISGRVLSLNGELGALAAVGSIRVVFDAEDGLLAAPAAPRASAPTATPPAERDAAPAANPPKPAIAPHPPAPTASQPKPKPVPRTQGLRPLASPAVRQRAYDLGVALQFVPGSGPAGRISQADLDAFLASGAPGPTPAQRHARTRVVEVPVIGLRRKIAEKMVESKRRIPHFSYVEECDVTELEHLREHVNANRKADQPRLTVLPFIIRGLVRLTPEFPQINATFDDEAGVVTRHEASHIGVAVQTPHGLIVPVLRHAESLTVRQMADEVSRLAEAARSGKAAREELSGSTFTITSLGPLGGLAATPVINHPEVGILCPNRIIERPVIRHGQITARKMMNLSSSFDHRVVDGHDAARFVQRLKELLEHPATLFMDE